MEYKSVKLHTLLRQDEIYLDIFIKIRDKYMQYTNKDFESKSQLDKLKQKNVEDVFLKKTDYLDYARGLVQKVESNCKKKIEESLDEYTKDYSRIKSLFQDAVQNKDKTEAALNFNKGIIDNIKKFNNLSSLMKSYMSNNKNSLVRKHITILTAYNVLREFVNVNNTQIETVIMAINLSDVLLTEEEFWSSYCTKNTDKLSEKIKFHGRDIVEKLPEKNIFNSMLLTQLIKFHHEKPDGTGYPNKINYTRFNQFHVAYFLSDELAGRVIEKKMRSNAFESATNELNEEFSKYGSEFTKVLSIMTKTFVGDDNA